MAARARRLDATPIGGCDRDAAFNPWRQPDATDASEPLVRGDRDQRQPQPIQGMGGVDDLDGLGRNGAAQRGTILMRIVLVRPGLCLRRSGTATPTVAYSQQGRSTRTRSDLFD
jgi:hypothetical protein